MTASARIDLNAFLSGRLDRSDHTARKWCPPPIYDTYSYMSRTELRILALLRRFLEKNLENKTATKGPDDYDLKIDDQVEKFLDLEQKLTYFLITASIGPIAFALSFVKDETKNLSGIWIAMAVGVVVGLLAAGLALFSLHFELDSYQKHLGCRYARKAWADLTKPEQDEWDKINARARIFLKYSFIALLAEITILTFFLMVLLHAKTRCVTLHGYWI